MKVEDILITFTYEKMAYPATGGRYSDFCPCQVFLLHPVFLTLIPCSRSASQCHVISHYFLSLLLCGWRWIDGFTVLWRLYAPERRHYLEVVKTTDPWNNFRSTTGQLRDSGKGVFCGALLGKLRLIIIPISWDVVTTTYLWIIMNNHVQSRNLTYPE